MNQTAGFIPDELSEISIDPIQKETQALVWNVSCNMQIPTVLDERPEQFKVYSFNEWRKCMTDKKHKKL